MTVRFFGYMRGSDSADARITLISGGACAIECDDDDLLEGWINSFRESVQLNYRRDLVAAGELNRQQAYVREPARCSYCLTWVERPALDHVVPKSKGGPDSPDNLVPACKQCNSRKKDRSLLDFVAAGGLLPMKQVAS